MSATDKRAARPVPSRTGHSHGCCQGDRSSDAPRGEDALRLLGRSPINAKARLRRSIGPAGENRVLYASVMMGDGNIVGRGGLGAVMGSKNLKAVAIYRHLAESWFQRM